MDTQKPKTHTQDFRIQIDEVELEAKM